MTTCFEDWPVAPPKPQLTEDDVHVWMAPVDTLKGETERLHALLSPDEQARAAKYSFEEGRCRFVTGRATLRRILGRYTGVVPESIRFDYGPHGKPYLPPAVGGGVQFNMSDTHGVTVFAVTRGREVGIDVEHVRCNVAFEKMARRYFAPGEMRKLLALPTEQLPTAFFNCWTRKEAFVKAIGMGLNYPLKDFEVSATPEESPAVLSVKGSAEEGRRWSIHSLTPEPDCIVAVIAEGTGWRVTTWRWA